MSRSLLALAFAGLVALSLGSPAPAQACRCLLQPLAGARAEATAIFEGRLERFETVGETSYAVFQVSRVWKGQVTRRVRVRASEHTMCPPHLQTGQTLIVYAMGPASDLRIPGCSRTAWSSEDAAELGPSRLPRAP